MNKAKIQQEIDKLRKLKRNLYEKILRDKKTEMGKVLADAGITSQSSGNGSLNQEEWGRIEEFNLIIHELKFNLKLCEKDEIEKSLPELEKTERNLQGKIEKTKILLDQMSVELRDLQNKIRSDTVRIEQEWEFRKEQYTPYVPRLSDDRISLEHKRAIPASILEY